MTFTDFFQLHPVYSIALIIIVFIWLLETLLLPFKINMSINILRRIETLLEQLKGRIEVNKEIDADYQKMVKLMQTILGPDKKEDK